MDKEQMERLIAILLDKLKDQEVDLSVKDFQIKNLKAEVARLENLLTPKYEVTENK